MRTLLRIIAVLALLWAGYWGAVWWGLSQGLPAWLDAREAEGWQAEVDGLSVSGFPLAFRTELRDVALADPDTGLAWRAPRVLAEAKAFRPLSLRVELPPEQTLASPGERIDLRSDVMEATLALAPGPDLAVTGATVRLRGVALNSTAGWSAALAEGTLTSNRLDDDPLTHDIAFSARDARPAGAVLQVIDPAGLMPQVFDRMDMDLRASFDAPWDRHAIEDRRPQPRRIDLGRLAARWGQVELEAAGAVTLDEAGLPEGRISVRVVNWRDLLALAAGSGWVAEGVLPTLEAALGVLAGLSGGPETIDAPLSFQNGFMSLGPVPLGPAPRLVIR